MKNDLFSLSRPFVVQCKQVQNQNKPTICGMGKKDEKL